MGNWTSTLWATKNAPCYDVGRLNWLPEQPICTFDSMTDDEAVAFLETFDFVQGKIRTSETDDALPVWRISEDTVLKRVFGQRAFEPYTATLVGSLTSIPVPKVRKTVTWKGQIYFFMEYIDGNDLNRIWTSLSIWRKLCIAWTLRGYVAQLRKVAVSNIPGPIDVTGSPQMCVGHLFTANSDGPFSSYAELSAWYAKKRRITIALEKDQAKMLRKPPPPKMPHFDNSFPLVLTHGDIALHNVRLGHDGTVWLLDWGRSGVYPQWFEYASMMQYEYYYTTTYKALRSWIWLAPFIAGWYRTQDKFRARIGIALDNWAMDEPPAHYLVGSD